MYNVYVNRKVSAHEVRLAVEGVQGSQARQRQRECRRSQTSTPKEAISASSQCPGARHCFQAYSRGPFAFEPVRAAQTIVGRHCCACQPD